MKPESVNWVSVQAKLPPCTTHYHDNVFASEWYPVQVEHVKGWMRGQLLERHHSDGVHHSWIVENCPTDPTVLNWYPLPIPPK